MSKMVTIKRSDYLTLLSAAQCWNLHHDRSEYHEFGQPCPVEARLKVGSASVVEGEASASPGRSEAKDEKSPTMTSEERDQAIQQAREAFEGSLILAEQGIEGDSRFSADELIATIREKVDALLAASRASLEEEIERLTEERDAARKGLFHRLTGWDKDGQTPDQILDELQQLRNTVALLRSKPEVEALAKGLRDIAYGRVGTSLTEVDSVSVSVPTGQLPHDVAPLLSLECLQCHKWYRFTLAADGVKWRVIGILCACGCWTKAPYARNAVPVEGK